MVKNLAEPLLLGKNFLRGNAKIDWTVDPAMIEIPRAGFKKEACYLEKAEHETNRELSNLTSVKTFRARVMKTEMKEGHDENGTGRSCSKEEREEEMEQIAHFLA